MESTIHFDLGNAHIEGALRGAVVSLLLVFTAACLTSCERHDKEAAQKAESSSPSNSNSVRAGKTDRITDKSERGGSRKSRDQFLETIGGFDFKRGLTSDQIETISAFVKYYPKDALGFLFNKDNISQRVGFSRLCEELAGTGDEQLIGWLNDSLPQFTNDKRIIESYWADAIKAIAKNDPDKALKVLLSSGLDEKSMGSSVLGLFFITSKNNPDKTLRLIEQLPDSQKDQAYLGLSYSLAQSDPAKSLEFAAMMHDSKEKSLAASRILSEWLKLNPEQASEKLTTLKGQFVEMALANIGNQEQFIENLCSSNPTLLRDLLSGITPNARNRPLFEESLMAMASGNMESALAVMNSLPQGPFRDDLFLKTFSTGDRPDDLAQVAQLIGSLEGNAKRNAAIGLGHRFASESVADILTAAGNFGAQEKSSFILSALIDSRTENLDDIVKALAGAELSSALSEKDIANVTEDVASRLATEDHAKAIFWYDSVPEKQKAAAMRGLAEEMAQNDIVELGKWLNSRDQDSNWAAGVSVLIKNLKKTDTEIANTWEQDLKSWKAQEKANQKK